MRYVAAVFVVLFSLYAAGRLFDNWETRGNVPPACQLMGGNWGFWSGWRCY